MVSDAGRVGGNDVSLPVSAAPELAMLHATGQIPLGPVPRNFLVANVTRKSPTCYELVTRKSAFRACRQLVTRKLHRSWRRRQTSLRGSYEELVSVEFGLKYCVRVTVLQMRHTRLTPFMIPDAVGRQLGLRDKRRIDIKLSRSNI